MLVPHIREERRRPADKDNYLSALNQIATVEPLNKGHFGTSHFVLCWEAVLFLEVTALGKVSKRVSKLSLSGPYIGGSTVWLRLDSWNILRPHPIIGSPHDYLSKPSNLSKETTSFFLTYRWSNYVRMHRTSLYNGGSCFPQCSG